VNCSASGENPMRRFRRRTGVEGRSVRVLPVLASAVTLTLSCRDVFTSVNVSPRRTEVRNTVSAVRTACE
jgi:hypothetical protein